MNDYQTKFVTPEQAVKAVQSGDWVDYGFGAGFPELLDRALAARKGEVKDVKVRGGLVIRPCIEIVESDPEQESFTYYSWHIGDYERKLQSRGLVKFMPVMLRSLPYLYRDKHIRCDVAFVPVSKPDAEGYCGLGISPYAWRTIFESARTVIFEINEHYPRLHGFENSIRVHLSEADYIVEGEHEPLPLRSYREPSETDIAIAKLVVEQIPDGAVLPVLGYFTRPFAYPVLTENGREWMTATPNEINTIRPMAEAAHGHVLTLGLGLGYFAFHALLNPRVESVTAVERSADAIRLFRKRILPAFPRPERLTILQADAFAAAPALYRSGQYDFVFADLWHDAADGLPMYERLKHMEVPGPEYRYWIEKTLEFY